MRCNSVVYAYYLRFFATVAALTVGVGGCGAHPTSLPSADLPIASQVRLGSVGSGDDWTTFAHDYMRSGYDPSVKGITKANVSKLKLRWKVTVKDDEVFSSPVVYAGNVIIVSYGKTNEIGSVVYDLSATDGHVIWQFKMGAEGQMTPTIDPNAGLVFVGNERKYDKTKPASLYALRLLDGSVAWSQQVTGLLRAAPVVTNGEVYIGLAGGDPPLCLQGGITALNESTGKISWTWNVDPTPNEGGSVWGAIAYDGENLIFGTGNTCQEPVTTANGAVALKPDGTPLWSMVAVKDSHYDSDTGGGVMLLGGHAYFINKNGRFYAVNQETGKIIWDVDLNPYARAPTWQGGFASPTTDGTTMVEASGLYKNTTSDVLGEYCLLNAVKPDEVFQGLHSKLEGMDVTGHVIWTREMQNRLVGYVALANGIGFVGLNQQFVALDLSNGKTLWKHKTPNYINASMVVVPSGVYGADQNGNVYAFALPKKGDESVR